MRRLLFMLLVLAAARVPAQELVLAASVEASLRRAMEYLQSVSIHGGYAGIWSATGGETFGEAFYERAAKGEIWIQPPGTPSVGEVFLSAYRVTGGTDFLEAARQVGLALAWAQGPAGGWDHRANLSRRIPDATAVTRLGRHGTFDDNISQGALTFLIHLDGTLDEGWLTEAVELGLAHLLAAQYPNGSWPQWYPLRGGYHDYATFNDGAINDCIRVALLAWRTYRKREYLECARRGGDFMILSQGRSPQEGWAQQYDAGLKPAWARAFEPPAWSSLSTVRNLHTLMDLHLETGEERFLTPIPAALGWLERSQLREGVWARLYEVGTNRPLYGDRDRKLHYTLEEISEERRRGYAWQGGFGVRGAAGRYARLRQEGREAFVARREAESGASRASAQRLDAEVRRILETQKALGCWSRGQWIYSQDFVANMGRLVAYLEALSAAP